MPFKKIPNKELTIASVKRAHAIATTDKYHHYTIDEMCAIIGMSPTYFKLWFKRLYKQPFVEYCRHYRMKEVKQLLVSGEYAFLADVWRLYGFTHHQNFIDAYQLVHGKHPNQDFLPAAEVHTDKLEMIYSSKKRLTIVMAAELTGMSVSFIKVAFKRKYGKTIGEHFGVKQGQNIKSKKNIKLKKRYLSAA